MNNIARIVLDLPKKLRLALDFPDGCAICQRTFGNAGTVRAGAVEGGSVSVIFHSGGPLFPRRFALKTG